MFFSEKELIAITRMALYISEADGIQHQRETDVIVSELSRFNVAPSDTPIIMVDALEMSFNEAVQIIRVMTTEEKRYVAAYLGVLIFIDEDINPLEIDMWTRISQECNLPSMTLQEAYNIMRAL